jgi:Flp pilus assembly protein protease CpaA
MVATILLLGLMLLATATDLARHKIYNWTTYTGMLAALGLSAAGSACLSLGYGSEAQLRWLGWISIWDSLAGLAACGLVMLVCFVGFRVGGGDVKLIAMLGAILGFEQGLTAMLWTFVLGGCTALIVLIWRVGPLRTVTCLLRQLLWTFGLGSWGPLSESERAQLQPPLFLAPSALAAVVIVRFLPRDLLF